MESSTNTEATLSLFDTTGQSTFALVEKENQIERLKRQPRLRNALGKDCTTEMAKLDKELLLAKEQCERWRNDFDAMSKKYEKFKKATIEQIDQRDKQIEQFRDQAMEMEEENGKLREMLQDEKSRVWRMHQEKFGSQLLTPKAQIFADVLSADPAQNVGVPENDEVVGESMCDFDFSMAETEYNLTVGSMAAVNLANRTSNLVEACVRMFDKLRGSTKFFQNLLKTFGVTAEELGEDIVGKIEAMKLDMNNSVGEAQIILTEVKDAEKNWRSILHDQSQAAVSFNSTVNTSTRNESKQEQQLSGNALELFQTPQTPLTTKCALKTEEIAELKMSLDNERTAKETLKGRVAGLEELIAQKGAENNRLLLKIHFRLQRTFCGERCLWRLE
ncbi:hypothetical protein GPALN_015625 [Globodera pallida]|nr:hypothetical protein GPALN_015625 [Globodera pallida]